VRVGVTAGARRLRGEEGSRFVARGALRLEWRVQAVKREARVSGVIEPDRVEGAKFSLDTGMFDVTGHAIGGDRAMNSLLRGDAPGDGLMARQALCGRHLLSLRVALKAVGHALESRMRPAQPPW
jgi:hypothetical protein